MRAASSSSFDIPSKNADIKVKLNGILIPIYIKNHSNMGVNQINFIKKKNSGTITANVGIASPATKYDLKNSLKKQSVLYNP